MPTGYTAPLYEGEPITFADFALRCARGMGALIALRDESLDAIAPDAFEPSPYHRDKLAEANDRLAALQAMTVTECRKAAAREKAKWEAERRASIAERRAMKARYEAMLSEVRAWTPPTPDHVGLKTFMTEQIEESIRFDCGEDIEKWWPAAPSTDPEAWREAQIAKALRDVQYNAKELAAERERAASRTAWVRALRASLPVEVPA